jgi:hypothetical protein
MQIRHLLANLVMFSRGLEFLIFIFRFGNTMSRRQMVKLAGACRLSCEESIVICDA